MVLKIRRRRNSRPADRALSPLNPTPMNAQLNPAQLSSTNPMLVEAAISESARTVIVTEARAIEALQQRVNGSFLSACVLMFQCQGRVVVTGIGKSGHIARKIAATLASTGTPAFFVHPAEASHGDLGMITQKDVVLSLSNSGETDELLTILPLIKRQNVPLIAMTGNEFSSLAKLADVHLDVSVSEEACPLGLAPRGHLGAVARSIKAQRLGDLAVVARDGRHTAPEVRAALAGLHLLCAHAQGAIRRHR